MKVEVDVLGSTSLISSPYGLCGRKATLKKNSSLLVAVFILVISIPWRMCMCGCMDRNVDGCVDGAREERSVRVWERRDRQRGRHTRKLRDRHTDRQRDTERQRDKERDRGIDRQRETERQTDRDRDTERAILFSTPRNKH